MPLSQPLPRLRIVTSPSQSAGAPSPRSPLSAPASPAPSTATANAQPTIRSGTSAPPSTPRTPLTPLAPPPSRPLPRAPGPRGDVIVVLPRTHSRAMVIGQMLTLGAGNLLGIGLLIAGAVLLVPAPVLGVALLIAGGVLTCLGLGALGGTALAVKSETAPRHCQTMIKAPWVPAPASRDPDAAVG